MLSYCLVRVVITLPDVPVSHFGFNISRDPDTVCEKGEEIPGGKTYRKWVHPRYVILRVFALGGTIINASSNTEYRMNFIITSALVSSIVCSQITNFKEKINLLLIIWWVFVNIRFYKHLYRQNFEVFQKIRE